jgi:hypothetical protein
MESSCGLPPRERGVFAQVATHRCHHGIFQRGPELYHFETDPPNIWERLTTAEFASHAVLLDGLDSTFRHCAPLCSIQHKPQNVCARFLLIMGASIDTAYFFRQNVRHYALHLPFRIRPLWF